MTLPLFCPSLPQAHPRALYACVLRQLPSAAALLAAVILATCISACTTPAPPPDNVPALELPAGWKQATPAQGWVSAMQANAWAQGQWWLLWDDATLHRLIAQVNENNASLQAAAARVAQAQAQWREQQAAAWPALTLNLGRQRSGGDDAPNNGSASLGLGASWAPDLWGRVRQAASAQGAAAQASLADMAGLRLSAQASLAKAYFALRAADAELTLLDDIINGYQRAARITQNRYNAGIAARTDTLQAQVALRSAQASRASLQRSRAGFENAIALLTGSPAASFDLPSAEWLDHTPSLPVEVPALLLLRRPDVAAAERNVAAANARIGVARAAYFPSLNITANVAGRASHLADIASAPALLWSLGLSLAQNLFDGGARDAQHAAALAAHQAAAATYRQTALAAMQEVEDQLSALHTLAAQIEDTRATAAAAARIEQQQMNRYQAGLAAYTEVITAQASALNARRSLLQLQLQRQQSAIILIEALGGGWQAPWTAEAEQHPKAQSENKGASPPATGAGK